MKDYRSILKGHWKGLAAILLFYMAGAALAVAFGYSLGNILNAYEAANPVGAVLTAVCTTMALLGGSVLLSYISGILRFRMERIIKNELRCFIAGKLSGLSFEDFLKQDSGVYVSWLNNDVEQIYQNGVASLFVIADNLFSAVFAFGVMVFSHWSIGLCAALLFVFQTAVPQLFGKTMEQAALRRSKALETSVEAYQDTIMGAGIFYLNNMADHMAVRIGKSSDGAEREIYKSNCTEQLVQSALQLLTLVNQIFLITVTAVAAVTGAIPLGMTLSVGNLCGQFFNGVQNTVMAVMKLRSSRPLWEKYRREGRMKGRQDETDAGIVLSDVSRISVKDVTYSYENGRMLKYGTLSFCYGGKYAVVGESGSGKTTLLKLLLGLLSGYEGQITYDGCDQRQTALPSLYEQVAYVGQQVYLFADTIRFNITLGQSYTDQEIMEAVKACRLEAFIYSLPDGLDTVLEENGKNLSGGQRQRIALARGLIRKVRYLILDEGTSALDEDNEREIEESLMKKNLGVILITHHLRDHVKQNLTAIYQLQ